MENHEYQSETWPRIMTECFWTGVILEALKTEKRMENHEYESETWPLVMTACFWTESLG